MPFEKPVPLWYAEGVEPPDSLKQSGYQPMMKPPSDYFNWFWYTVSQCIAEFQEKGMTREEILAALADIDFSNISNEEFREKAEEAGVGGYPLVEATSEDGIAYTATVEGLTELYNGLTIRIIPNIVSASLTPTLNVNGLGAIRIAMQTDYNNGSVVAPAIATWLTANSPAQITYREQKSSATGEVIASYWIVSWRRTSASGIYGQIPVRSGGWYIGTNTTEEEIAEALENYAEMGLLTMVDAQSAEYDMDTIFTSGAHFSLYKTNETTLGTPYAKGVTTSSGAVILSFATSVSYGTQMAWFSGAEEPMVRYLAGGTVGDWASIITSAGGEITGTLVLSKTTEASETADNGPALVVGGSRASAHLELDANEIIAKSNDTTQTLLNVGESKVASYGEGIDNTNQPRIRNIYAGTGSMTSGTTSLTTGRIYVQYV